MLKPFLSPIARITFGLVGLTTSIILLGTFAGIFPDHRTSTIRNREKLCESIAMSFSSIANRVDVEAMTQHFESFHERYPEIQSIGLRKGDGARILEVGDHFDQWTRVAGSKSTSDEISLPIYGYGEHWGDIEFRFEKLDKKGIAGIFQRTELALAIFVSLVGSIAFYIYLRVVLRQLSPQRVVPRRVRDALDTLAEGLLILDKNERIVLANKAFLNVANLEEKQVIGKQAGILGFEGVDEHAGLKPWQLALAGEPANNCLMRTSLGNKDCTFSVSCAPIVDDKGNRHGAIASFEDVTQLQQKTQLLKQMLNELDASTAEIKRQNRELEFLATRDPLTGSMNRRSFFQEFNRIFTDSVRDNKPLSAFMVDIDHFKSINDNHGHGVGDEVLQEVAFCLEDFSRDHDIVCRYGGEEFSVLLPATTIEDAAEVAERMRVAIEQLKPANLKITTSIGVSSLSTDAESPQELIEHADKCLYFAKKNGRNRVIRYDQVPADLIVDESSISRTREEESYQTKIPFHAVTALISALAYRDQETANHCRRVADLCVAVAEGLLPMKDCYILEIAGLMHDIGKIGIPDSILLKAGKLDEEEWQTIKLFERIGVEILNTTFDCEELVSIVKNSYLSNQRRLDEKIATPIGSRILKIADAYDSMTSDRPYRKGMTQKEAFAELRRNAGPQFDPELVERVIQIVKIRGKDLDQGRTQMSKSAALSIGLQIERLSLAIDERDKDGITAIASRLHESAKKHGATEVSQKAIEITEELQEDGDLYEIVRATNELLDICRAAQKSLLQTDAITTRTPLQKA